MIPEINENQINKILKATQQAGKKILQYYKKKTF